MSKKTRKPSQGPWYRMYVSILDNPKLARLTPAQRWDWVLMLAVAVTYGGLIPEDLTDVAHRLRRSLGKTRELFQLLISAQLLERCAGGYIPHDWQSMQFDSDVSTSRVQKFREQERNAQRNGDETLHETVSERPHRQSTETEKEEVVERARSLLTRICEILRVELQADPSRITWHRQVEEMLRDGIPEADVLAGAEVARTNAVLNLNYIRAVALKVRNAPKEAPTNGRRPRESVQDTWIRAGAELAQEFETGNGDRDHDPPDGAGSRLLGQGHVPRRSEDVIAANVPRFGGKN